MSRFATLDTEAERRRREREDALALLLLGFTYDADRLAYFTRSGARVPQRTIRLAVDAVVDATRDDIRDITRGVMEGETDVAEWQETVARKLKTMHTAAWAAGAGGFENMSPAAVAQLEGVVRFHVTHLQGFAEDLARGFTRVRSVQVDENGELIKVVRIVPMTERRMLARADLYAEAGRSDGYEGGRRQAAGEVGYRFERNILAPADHCDGCLEQTARGWVGYGQLVPCGRRDCKTRCRCQLQFARELRSSISATP